MRYAGIIKNDLANAPGVCVSFFTQGCRRHCPHCFNPETWDFEGGRPFNAEVLDEILEALTANGIHRDLCILGGEPLCEDNVFLTQLVVKTVKEKLPQTKIYIWTGYLYEQLIGYAKFDTHLDYILKTADVLIDGPYQHELRDLTLHMRGSSNQRILNLKELRK